VTDPPDTGLPPPGARLPASLRIGAVRLQVHDLARSVRYYETTLGLRVLGQSGGAAVLGIAESGHPLVELRENPHARPARTRRLGLFHFAILVPTRSALGRFVEHALPLETLVGMADHAVSEAVYLTDPDGLGIEVYADRPREAWRYMGRELYMTTDVLDVREVIAAAAGERWAGMPSGTVMGHVHFSVDDLGRASGFYHEALGLDQTVWSYPGALFYSAGGYHHHVATNTWSKGAPMPGPDTARLLEWELVLPGAEDVRQLSERLRSSGHQVRQEGDGWWATDPWETVLRVRPAARSVDPPST
jgi:catechol 2,3-dioxygenase